MGRQTETVFYRKTKNDPDLLKLTKNIINI